MMKLKKYQLPDGDYHYCLHCELERIVDTHRWVGVTEGQIARMILKDLLNVLLDFTITHGIYVFKK